MEETGVQLHFLKERPREHTNKFSECLKITEAFYLGKVETIFFPNLCSQNGLQKVFPTLVVAVFFLAGRWSRFE